jgi:hypothetical protein
MYPIQIWHTPDKTTLFNRTTEMGEKTEGEFNAKFLSLDFVELDECPFVICATHNDKPINLDGPKKTTDIFFPSVFYGSDLMDMKSITNNIKINLDYRATEGKNSKS